MSDKKERARIANISVIARGDFKPVAFCFTKIALSHAHFPVNFHRNWSTRSCFLRLYNRIYLWWTGVISFSVEEFKDLSQRSYGLYPAGSVMFKLRDDFFFLMFYLKPTIKKTLKALENFLKIKKCIKLYFWYAKVHVFRKFFQYNIQWDKTQMSKKIPSGNINVAKNAFFLHQLQLITILILINNSYMSWSPRFVSLKVCGGFSIFGTVSFL